MPGSTAKFPRIAASSIALNSLDLNPYLPTFLVCHRCYGIRYTVHEHSHSTSFELPLKVTPLNTQYQDDIKVA